MVGSCFGFGIESKLDLQLLRSGSGSRLTVVQRVAEPDRFLSDSPMLQWSPTWGNPFEARLYRFEHRYRLVIEGQRFEINTAERRIDVPTKGDPVRTEERLWGLPAMLLFVHDGDISLHGAAVELLDRGVVLCGPSLHGKTTLAVALQLVGHRLLSGDLVRVGSDSESCHVYPGPAGVRMRRDSFDTLSPDWPILVEEADRVHLAIPKTLRGTGEPRPLGAILLLRGESDEVTLTAADKAAALRDLWHLSYHNPDHLGRAGTFAGLANLVDRVPVFDLRYPHRYAALGYVAARIARMIADV